MSTEKALPTVPAVLAKGKDEVHKSYANRLHEREREKITFFTQASYQIAPEVNHKVHVEFKTPFRAVPFVSANIICDDDEGGITHYMSNLTPKDCYLWIENTTNLVRNVIIQVRAQTMD